jgi:hypothetical protein
VFGVPLSYREIGVLIDLGWLREGAESNRKQVGQAIACLLREAAISKRWR